MSKLDEERDSLRDLTSGRNGMATRTILVPLDESQFSRQIARIVRTFISPDDVELVLLRTIQPPVDQVGANQDEIDPVDRRGRSSAEYGDGGQDADSLVSPQASHSERQQVEAELAAEVGRLASAGYSARSVVQYGESVKSIIEYANANQVDLIAVVTHGTRGLGRLVRDSVAERVVHGVSVPVLLMRSSSVNDEDTDMIPSESARVSDGVKLRIVAATDCSTLSKRAVVRTRGLVQALRADLELLVVASDEDSVDQVGQLVEETRDLVNGIQPAPRIVPLAGYADEAILAYLVANPADLLSIGAFQDRGETSVAAIGPTALRLVQYSPTSVLICKGHRREFRRVLACLAVDDSEFVEAAARLAEAMGATLSLLHVIPASAASYLSSESTEGSFVTSPVVLGQFLSQGTPLARLLRSWIDELGEHGLGQESMLLEKGSVPEAILATAQEGAYDLIVVGSDSSPGRYPSSVASNVVRYAEQSVLLLRNIA